MVSIHNQRIGGLVMVVLVSEKIKKHASEADAGWGAAYGLFGKVIERKKLKTGVEIGVAFGGHSESLLRTTSTDKLYGVDPYLHIDDYEDPMNLPQEEFDQLYDYTLKRLSRFGERYQHIRKCSIEAVNNIPEEIDFIYIDADHSYKGVWEDLCIWYPQVRIGGVIGGHDYGHLDFPGVKQAIDEFFGRFGWEIHEEGEGVWWTEKNRLNISFILPAYNCVTTVEESVESIMEGNFIDGDELVIVNDCSSDNTENVLIDLQMKYPIIKIIKNSKNRGGAATRNVAIENTLNQIIFCLDSDNVLVPGSIQMLKNFLENSGADAASFQELHYFHNDKNDITRRWIFKGGITTLSDYLSGAIVPGSSGNYMFTKESWTRAGGYPEFSGALDAWGFGFRQVATGSKMIVMPKSYYYHRYGHESYWVRESQKGNMSLIASQILIPFLNLIDEKDVYYITSRRGRCSWFNNLEKRPIRVKSGVLGSAGITTKKKPTVFQAMLAKGKGAISRILPNTIKKELSEFLKRF